MAPKRKAAEIDPEAAPSRSRPTRSSAVRDGTDATGSVSSFLNSSSSKSKSKGSAKSTTKETTEKKTNKNTKTSEDITQPEEGLEPPSKKGKLGSSANKMSPVTSLAKAKFSAYSKPRMAKLFTTYADPDNPSWIGGEGLERLCIDGDISMEGSQPLILAWLLEASELGKLSKDEWHKGFDALQIDTPEKLRIALTEYETLIISQTPPSKPLASNKKAAVEPYNRNVNYWRYATNIQSAFSKFYTFVFSLAKAPQERNIDIEMAKAFWSALLSRKYPLTDNFIEYLNTKSNIKGVNKDVWAMTLCFLETVSPTLEGYEDDGAWPTLIDDFVTWKKTQLTETEAVAVEN